MTRLLPLSAFLVLLVFGFAPDAAAQTTDADALECTDDENERRIHYSLYYESYKAGDYASALPEIEWILACAPAFGGTTPDDRNVRRAIQIYDSLAVRAEDPAQQEEYLEEALDLLEDAPSMLADAGVEVSEYDYVIKKGRFIQSHPELLADEQGEVYDLYLRAFELQPDSLSDYYINYIAAIRTTQANEEDTPAAKASAREFLSDELTPRVDDASYIDGLLDTLITTPREQYAFLKEKFQEDPANLSDEELDTLYRLNQNPELNDPALKTAVAEVLVERNPTPSLLQTLAGGAAADGNYDQALSLYERALEIAEDDATRRDIYYNIATMKYQQGQLATASNYAREALDIDSDHGPSLLLIGNAIASSVSGSDVRARAAYWCAIDYFNRATNDPQVASQARSAIGTYSRYTPTNEEYFFLGWKPGQSITASYGWGSCTTTVR
jgi:tetratricopeptide (TPR) repeat protein